MDEYYIEILLENGKLVMEYRPGLDLSMDFIREFTGKDKVVRINLRLLGTGLEDACNETEQESNESPILIERGSVA